MKLPTDRTVFQNAWVVDDVYKACQHWIDFYGVGPFYMMEHLDLHNLKYRGAPAELDISVGLAQAGNVQIELIQQFNDGPSVYRDIVPKGKTGYHHFCIYTHDYAADKAYFEENGYATGMEGTSPDGSVTFAYFDTVDELGVFTEVVNPAEGIVSRNRDIAAAAENWDGSDPIRIATADGYRVP
jgi:hypothetical protein